MIMAKKTKTTAAPKKGRKGKPQAEPELATPPATEPATEPTPEATPAAEATPAESPSVRRTVAAFATLSGHYSVSGTASPSAETVLSHPKAVFNPTSTLQIRTWQLARTFRFRNRAVL